MHPRIAQRKGGFDSEGVFTAFVIAGVSAIGAVIGCHQGITERERAMSATLYKQRVNGFTGFGSHPRLAMGDAIRKSLESDTSPSVFSHQGKAVVVWYSPSGWKWAWQVNGKVKGVQSSDSEESTKRSAVFALCLASVDAATVFCESDIPECMDNAHDRQKFFRWITGIRRGLPENAMQIAEEIRPSGHL